MKLNSAALGDLATQNDYAVPQYDREKMEERTKAAPTWLHFGAGNLFRAFPAVLGQRLLNEGAVDKGIICCESYDPEVVTKFLRPYDNLAVSVTLCADGTMEKEVVGSIAESLILPEDRARVEKIFKAPTLQMVSFTITEKGYSLRGTDGDFLPAVKVDLSNPPECCQTFLATLVSCCLLRFEACGKPLALVSMDNCSHNGEKLREAFFQILDAWHGKGYVSDQAYEYAREKLSFPWSMIDKITPRPHESVQQSLEKDGLEGMEIQVTSKKTYIAPFVNTEKPQYLVVEEDFPNGRPPLEKAGVLFASRETVTAVESMKVCTCLNPLHTALAIFGCLLGYDSIAKEMGDKDLRAFVTEMSQREGMPVVTDPGIIRPESFLREVLTQRFPNPFIPDTPQRIATDTSQKLPVRFGVNMGLHKARGTLGKLVLMPLVYGGWLRYLKGMDDQGKAFSCSPDPLLEKLQPVVQKIPFGEKVSEETFGGLLEDKQIWGLDLKESGLSSLVVSYFNELNQGIGAVRRTLHKYVIR